MSQLWYNDELIGEKEFFKILPKEQDLVQVEYGGELRDFIVKTVRNYYPADKQMFTRIYLDAWGGWDIGYNWG